MQPWGEVVSCDAGSPLISSNAELRGEPGRPAGVDHSVPAKQYTWDQNR